MRSKSKKKMRTPLGEEIATRLIKMNMTHRELAERIGANEKYLNLIIYGERSGSKYLEKIGQVLKINVDKYREVA